MKKTIKLKEEIITHKIIEVEIEFPFYFKHYVDVDFAEVNIYGKIDIEGDIMITTKIDESIRNDYDDPIQSTKYEIVKEYGVSQFYFKKENASTKSEYEKAKQRCLNFLNQ